MKILIFVFTKPTHYLHNL